MGIRVVLMFSDALMLSDVVMFGDFWIKLGDGDVILDFLVISLL